MYTIREFSKKIKVGVKTLQKWDREGRLVAKRTISNRRYYTQDDLARVLNEGKQTNEERKRKIVVYSRVSSKAQKADLANQKEILEMFCAAKGLEVSQWIEEIGGGLNLKRKKFIDMLQEVLEGEIETIVIAHKDRLARFGYELIEYLCQKNECKILVFNSEKLSPQEEMVQDLMTIVHTFSSRLYGLRNYKKTLQKALVDDKNSQN